MEENRRMIGIDYGSKRIGVAMSDPLNIIAQGLCVVPNTDKALSTIMEIVRKHNACTIVIGIPFNLKGDRGNLALEAETFAHGLEENLSIPVIRQDERFTSTIAHRTLRSMNTGKKERRNKERIDLMAASLILQSYMDRLNFIKKEQERK
jgi:putative Holliday junction resolvase